MAPTATRCAYCNAMITPDNRDTCEHPLEDGETMEAFCSQTCCGAAREDYDRLDRPIVVDPEAWDDICDAIENPRPPTQALIDLFKR